MFKLQIYYKSILFYFIKNVNQIQNIQKYFRKDKISSGTQLHSLFYFTSTVFIHFLPIAYTLFLNSKIRFLLFQFAKTAKNYSPTFGSTQQYVRQKSFDELYFTSQLCGNCRWDPPTSQKGSFFMYLTLSTGYPV